MEPRFSLPSGKAPYHPIHTGPAAERYTDRPLPDGIAKIDCRWSISTVSGRLREKSTVDGRLKKKKRRRNTWRRPRLRAARGSPASHRRQRATFVPARGDETSLRAERRFSRRPRLRAARGSLASHRRPRRPRATFVPARGDETSLRAGRETEAMSPPLFLF
ncbi:hypothetical protein BHM03_00014903 [Ensete ventricosum]|nr:hypothetical protein BHM03_00014903 [Ensete ventricosum]